MADAWFELPFAAAATARLTITRPGGEWEPLPLPDRPAAPFVLGAKPTKWVRYALVLPPNKTQT